MQSFSSELSIILVVFHCLLKHFTNRLIFALFDTLVSHRIQKKKSKVYYTFWGNIDIQKGISYRVPANHLDLPTMQHILSIQVFSIEILQVITFNLFSIAFIVTSIMFELKS